MTPVPLASRLLRLVPALLVVATAAPLAAQATDSLLSVSSGDSSLFRVNRNGRVGIGTSDPAERLQVMGRVRADSGFVFADGTVQTTAAAGSSADSPVLLRLQAGSPLTDRMRVDSSGAFVAYGFVRDVGNTAGCAAQIPASGAGTRFEWIPCRGSVRFGRVPAGQANWDDSNMDDFTFAGGNQVVASEYGAFAYGDQVTVSSTVGVGFGSAVTVSGTAGFSAGASNVCSGFACTAIGYTNRAGGQGSVALGYRATAAQDYAVTIGYRGSNNTHVGSIVLAAIASPTTFTDSVRAQNDGEFRVRAPGGIALRTSNPASNVAGAAGNTGCDLAAGSGTWSCSSSRLLKEEFEPVDGEAVLTRLRGLPISTWRFQEDHQGGRHMGPVAEDFFAAFGLGSGPTSIGTTDLSGVALAAVQTLAARNAELERRVAELQARVDSIDELRAEVAALRAAQGTPAFRP